LQQFVLFESDFTSQDPLVLNFYQLSPSGIDILYSEILRCHAW
jgi:hypothetical protein